MAFIKVTERYGSPEKIGGTYSENFPGIFSFGNLQFVWEGSVWELDGTTADGSSILETGTGGDSSSPATATWPNFDVTDYSAPGEIPPASAGSPTSPGQLPASSGGGAVVTSPGSINPQAVGSPSAPGAVSPQAPGVPDKPENYLSTAYAQNLSAGQRQQLEDNWPEAVEKTDLTSITPEESFSLRKALRLKTDSDREAETYGTTHALGADAVARIANFLTGLEGIGIKSSLGEVALYGAKFQPASGATAFSLLGNSDLAITGSPVRQRHGFFLNNDDPTTPTTPTRLYGDLSSAGEWTILTHDARQIYGDNTAQRRSFNALTVAPYSAYIQMQNGTNWSTYSFAGGAAATINGAKGPNDALYRPVIARNATIASADSFSSRRFDTASVETTGRGSVALSKLSIGAGTSNGSAFAQYFDGLSSYWMLWNTILADTAIAELGELIDETIAPEYRIVIEGDSIAANVIGWGYHLRSNPGFLGANIDLQSVATGGEATPAMVSQIGTAQGINDSQSSTQIPVLCLIQAGTNDPGAAPDAADTYTAGAVETHANLRTMWEAARARGMKVIACTVPRADIDDPGGAAEFWNTGSTGETSYQVKDQLNALIRADEGIRYDYLLDVHEILVDEFGALYWQDPACFSDGLHPGTDPNGAGGVVMTALSDLLSTEIL